MGVQQVLLGYGATGSGPVSYFDAVMADSPVIYARHAESSGTVAENEVGTDGTYVSPTFAQAALYTGGLQSTRFNASGAGASFPASLLTSATAITLETIIKPAAVTGNRQIITRDADTGDRRWQWLLDGANMKLIELATGVNTVSVAHGMSAGVVYILQARIAADGAVKLLKNGVSLTTGGFGAGINYGSASRAITVGKRDTGLSTDNTFSETAIYNTALSDARLLAHAQAAGLA